MDFRLGSSGRVARGRWRSSLQPTVSNTGVNPQEWLRPHRPPRPAARQLNRPLTNPPQRIKRRTGMRRKSPPTKVRQELDQLQAARDAMRRDSSKSKMAAAHGEERIPTPQPEAKHMTAKPQATMDFDESGQVHVSAPASPAAQSADQITAAPSTGSRKRTAAAGPERGCACGFASGRAPSAPSRALGGIVARWRHRLWLTLDPSHGPQKSPQEAISAEWFSILPELSSPTRRSRGRPERRGDPRPRIPRADFRSTTVPRAPTSVKAEASGFKATEIKQVAVLGRQAARAQRQARSRNCVGSCRSDRRGAGHR